MLVLFENNKNNYSDKKGLMQAQYHPPPFCCTYSLSLPFNFLAYPEGRF